MSAVAGSIVAVVVGCATILATWSGTYTYYVKSGLRWPLILSGLVLVGAGTVSLVIALRRRTGRGTVEGVGALLIVFVAALALAPPPLGADAATDRTPNRIAPPSALEPIAIADAPEPVDDVEADVGEPPAAGSSTDPLQAGAPEAGAAYPMTLFDLVNYSMFLPEEVLDEPFELVGFVAPEPDIPDAFRLTRYLMSWCAADSFPLQVTLVGAPTIPDQDQWLTVEAIWHGEVTGLNEFGEGVPVLEVISMTPIDPPAEPYEY